MSAELFYCIYLISNNRLDTITQMKMIAVDNHMIMTLICTDCEVLYHESMGKLQHRWQIDRKTLEIMFFSKIIINSIWNNKKKIELNQEKRLFDYDKTETYPNVTETNFYRHYFLAIVDQEIIQKKDLIKQIKKHFWISL